MRHFGLIVRDEAQLAEVTEKLTGQVRHQTHPAVPLRFHRSVRQPRASRRPARRIDGLAAALSRSAARRDRLYVVTCSGRKPSPTKCPGMRGRNGSSRTSRGKPRRTARALREHAPDDPPLNEELQRLRVRRAAVRAGAERREDRRSSRAAGRKLFGPSMLAAATAS